MIRFLILKNNEEGAAILIALMVIAALSIVGLSAMDTSINELQIVRNEKIYNLNFYGAESINQRGMQQLIDAEPDKVLNLQAVSTTLVYLLDVDVNDVSVTDMRNPENWQIGVNCTGRAFDGTFPNNAPDPDGNPDTPDNEQRFAALDNGIAAGGSLSMSGGSQMHSFRLYGLSQEKNGQVLIETGFLAEF